MAITFGGGITLGGGISVNQPATPPAPSTVTYTAGADYTNLSEIIGGLIFFYVTNPSMATFLQTLVGNETFTYSSYGSTYTTELTTPFTYNSGSARWQASAVNTGGSYVDTVTFPS